MKYVKMLGLLAVAAAALMAFAGTAAATSLTSSAGETPTIKATAGLTELHPGSGGGFLTVKCNKSSVEGTVTTHGSTSTVSGQIPEGPPKALTFEECGNDVVTVLKTGSLEVHADPAEGAPTGDGTLTSTGAEIRIHTRSGPVCTFKTSATDIGTLTSKEHAILDIQSASIPASGFLCPSSGVWTGSYTVNSPTNLAVH